MYGCLPLLIISFFVVFFSAILGFLRLIFGVRNTAQRFTDAMNGKTGKNSQSESQTKRTKTKTKQKFFDKSEGQYVDFEEMK